MQPLTRLKEGDQGRRCHCLLLVSYFELNSAVAVASEAEASDVAAAAADVAAVASAAAGDSAFAAEIAAEVWEHLQNSQRLA